jgi:hypothetical protein
MLPGASVRDGTAPALSGLIHALACTGEPPTVRAAT